MHQKSAHEHVLLNRHARKNRGILENIGDAGMLKLFVGAQAGDVLTVDLDFSAGDVGKTVNGVQDRGFSGTVRSDETKGLTGADLHIEVVQDHHFTITGLQSFNG